MYNEKLKFEDPDVPNFVFWANPDTFQKNENEFGIEGDLIVWRKNRSKKYFAKLFAWFKSDEELQSFEEVYHSDWVDWMFEVKGYEVEIVNNELVVRKERSIRTAISIPENLYKKIEKAAKNESRSVAGMIRYILERHFEK